MRHLSSPRSAKYFFARFRSCYFVPFFRVFCLGINVGGLALSTGMGAGCASTPGVATSLPLSKVVVYRNGIAYFERYGDVDGESVHFKVKEDSVGDFLATLAVMENGGSTVRAAAFPIHAPEDVPECNPEVLLHPRPVPQGYVEPIGLRPCTEHERRGIRTVVLALDGRDHQLSVSYVTESPVWRPSYRLVVQPGGKAELQAWGIVQNLSGEDWKNVKLELVSGAPLAFQATLGKPSIPPRPTITDEGEVIASVPRGETSFSPSPLSSEEGHAELVAGDDEPQAAAAVSADSDEAVTYESTPRSFGASSSAASKSKKGEKEGKAVKRSSQAANHGIAAQGAAMSSRSEARAVAPRQAFAPSAPRDLRSLAAISSNAATTRFILPNLVTVPDKSATMVLLMNKTMAGEAAWLYAPDGGVPDSVRFPFRIARFKNDSGGGLERGPIAVFEKGSFLGQGLIEPLPSGSATSVPFALDRSIDVEHSNRSEEKDERVSRIENGQLFIERDSATLTTYKVRNQGDSPVKLYVKYIRQAGAVLKDPPSGTEDSAGSALVPIVAKAKSQVELTVDERRSFERAESWLTELARSALLALKADPHVNAEQKKKIDLIFSARNELSSKMAESSAFSQQVSGIEHQTEELRRNLEAIEKNKLAAKLRGELTKRLSDYAKKADEVGKKRVEADAKIAELSLRMQDLTRELRYDRSASK